MKPILFAANWKLNKGPKETREFFAEFKGLVPADIESKTIFFVPATNMEATAEGVRGTRIRFGSQNCHNSISGAFTGEISAQVVKDIGAQFVLLGHSERRQLFSEKDEVIALKGKLVQNLGLAPMLCIGETLQERESGQTLQICQTQLRAFMHAIDLKKAWIVAYEPVWAIGTGKVATTGQVAETHAQLRQFIISEGGSSEVPILYGGSVKPENASDLLQITDVNGFLVGGASLDPKSFASIANTHSSC
jgi:triosephosphate isomerase